MEHAKRAPFRANLLEAYTNPSRRYHDLTHISECLEALEDARIERKEWFRNTSVAAGIELALIEHDRVYEPGNPANEELSAAMARVDACDLGLGDEAMKVAMQCVRATAHRGMAETLPERAVCDIDLLPLAISPTAFNERTEYLRFEFSRVPRDAFIANCKTFFITLLARPRIYQTEYFAARYECRARTNLRKFITNAH